ncbi:hypothetical protein AtEden1_Chr1g0064341 [Arabidopsis thaliana]
MSRPAANCSRQMWGGESRREWDSESLEKTTRVKGFGLHRGKSTKKSVVVE